jgi:hypothetical protein
LKKSTGSPSYLTGYQLIKEFYGNRIATRSKLPLMNHIDEGIIILTRLSAKSKTIEAFCIHPMLQDDANLIKNAAKVYEIIDPMTMMLAMEYRHVANDYLSPDQGNGAPKLSPLYEVNQMLVADKIQNRKDFEIYHLETHPRNNELDAYFKEWLAALHVSEREYKAMCRVIKEGMCVV